MKPEHFEIYRHLLKEKSGIIVTPDKTYLLESRLTPLSREHGFESLEAMGDSMKVSISPDIENGIIEAMTTNETSFFRDKTPFDNFENVCIPYFLEARKIQKNLKIWCAAASSGQEPYSLHMLLQEHYAKDMPGWKHRIFGTDLSNDILDQAREGIYSQFEVQRGLPIQLMVKYFTQVEEKWQINEECRKAIEYKQYNLLDSFSMFGTYDMIFCRNVLIYFDEETKGDILNRLAKQLDNDGFLFLGGAETVLGITDAFVPLPGARGIYVRKDSSHLQKTEDQAVASLA